MTCDCCGGYDPWIRIGRRHPRLVPKFFLLAAVCSDCTMFAVRSGLSIGDVADLLQLCWSIDTARV